MTFAPSLETLFVMLRNAEIRVGIEEVARLAEVFALEPSLDRAGLTRVLQSVLLKSTDEYMVFERVFAAWMGTLEQQLEAVERAAGAAEDGTKLSRKRAALAGKHAPLAGKMAAAPGAPGFASPSPAAPAGPQMAKLAEKRQAGDARAAADEDDDTGWLSEGRADPGPREVASVVSLADRGVTGASAQPLMQALHQAPASAGERRSRPLRLVVFCVLLAVFGVMLGQYCLSSSTHENRNQTAGVDANRTDTDSLRDAGAMFAPHPPAMLRVVQPEITVAQQPMPRTGMFAFVLAACALGLIIWLWARFGRATWLPGHGLRESDAVPALARAPARRSLETLMLDERDEEELVWGVGRFVSQEFGRDLDIDSTVRETASAYGRPVLVYQGNEYQREVWLWIDESVDTPVLRQLADDLTLMLEKSGLPVMQATFWGLPERLRTSGDEVITVDAFDTRRDSVAVAVLSDGRMMGLAHRARNRRGDLHNLLRNLAYWPRVTFIDFGDGRLGPLCEGHGLRVVKPADAAGAISEFAEPYERPAEYEMLVGDARVWAAACALSPHPVADREALALRRELALDVSPWVVERLRGQAGNAAGGIDFPVEQRASLLAWLVEAEDLSGRRGRLSRSSLLARAVEAWDRVLERRRDTLARAAYKSGQVTQEDVGGGPRELSRACIHLWTDPDHAVARLYRMHEAGNGRTRQDIERWLGHLGTREEMDQKGVIALPWSLAQVRRETRVMLGELGFGRACAAPAIRVTMPAPGRVWLALGLALGLLAGAVSGLVNQRWLTEKPEPVLEERGWRPDNAFIERTHPDRQTWRADVGTPWTEPRTEYVKRGEQVMLSWETASVPCMERRGSMTIYRCRADGKAPGERMGEHVVEREFWSFAIIVGRHREQAETVSAELLDSGSVDGVYVIASAQGLADIPMANLARPRAQQAAGAWDQLLVVAPAERPDSLDALLGDYTGRAVLVDVDRTGALIGMTDDFDGWKSLAALRPPIVPESGRAEDFRVRGMGPCGAEGQRCCAEPLERCEGDLRCDGAMCVDGGCKTSEPDRCVDGALTVCTEAGTWQTRTCADTEVCDGEKRMCRPRTCEDLECDLTAERCDAEAVACVRKSCGGSETLCNAKGTKFRRCDAAAGDWGSASKCLMGSLCEGKSPCQPIRHARIEFQRVEFVPHVPERGEWRYRMDCTVGSSTRRFEHEFKLTTIAGKNGQKARWAIELPYGESRRHIRLACETGGFKPVDPASSLRFDDKGAMSGSAIHGWDLSVNDTHQMSLGGSAYASEIIVNYKISLELGFGDVAPFEESESNQAIKPKPNP